MALPPKKTDAEQGVDANPHPAASWDAKIISTPLSVCKPRPRMGMASPTTQSSITSQPTQETETRMAMAFRMVSKP